MFDQNDRALARRDGFRRLALLALAGGLRCAARLPLGLAKGFARAADALERAAL
jgi:hypothetical protein